MIFIQVPVVWSTMWFLEGYHIESPSFQDIGWKQPLIFSHVSFTNVAAHFPEASKKVSSQDRFQFLLYAITHIIPSPLLCSVGSKQVTGPIHNSKQVTGPNPKEEVPQESQCQEMRVMAATLEYDHPQ